MTDDRSFDRLAAAVAARPDDTLVTSGRSPWMGVVSLADAPLFGHPHDEHEPAIREWRRARGERQTR